MYPTFSFCLSLLFAFNFIQNTITSSLGNKTDNLALLKFKESIYNDPNGILASWNSSTHYCNWHGITCSPMHQRVTKLNLNGYNLHGFISPHVGNLSFLKYLNLANNSFFGKIPNEFSRLFRLQKLFINNNSITGEIPTNLSSCSNLEVLFLSRNHLIGKIPIGISSLHKLRMLEIPNNNLTGRIPSFIGNLSSLINLGMARNHLEGNIPQEMCYLKNLTRMVLESNRLNGTFPSCLYNMSSLTIISAVLNEFNGSLLPGMFNTLSNLQYFIIGGNQFTGTIPISIANASALIKLDLSENHLFGQVPSLGKLHDLQLLNLELNNLGDNSTKDLEFLKSLTNCSKLRGLSISYNNFGGKLPNFVGNLSNQLSHLHLAFNMISGKIPAELGNLIGLTLLSVQANHFEGIIPTTFGKFENMQLLVLQGNQLSGEIPAIIGNLSQLYLLSIGDNMLEGNIPSSIGNCKKLQYLDLSQNILRGIIPIEVFSLSSLTNLLNLSKNSFSGSLPKEVGMLKNINKLDVSENHLSGNIPRSIGDCTVLEYLYLQGNSFSGTIPSSLASLKGLRYLDLSKNLLSGPIPTVLQNISVLEHLNISFNMLEGKVPIEGVCGNVSRLTLTGNNKLCGGISELHLQPCLVKGLKQGKHHKIKLIVVIVSVISILLMMIVILTIYYMWKRNQKQYSDSPTTDTLAKVSYQDLHNATDGFSASNLVGLGSFGSVYKGNLASEDKVVAIKVLNLQKKGAHKSFIAECNTLKNVRHRNLVKILTCCSSTDYKGQEFKALVFEYMNNGSLEQWLHPGLMNAGNQRMLDLNQRLNIIVGIASVLHYLHHECEQLVIHCDLKPSNVLLDDDMIAHVSDFGIARLVSTIDNTSHKESSTIGIKGTIGYAPPEYGMGSEISIYGDMYSFGVLMLEMLTGRRPTDEMFEDGQNLHMFVENSFPNNLIQILDLHLLPRNEAAIEDENNGSFTPIVEKCLVSLFRIGLACSVESPKERMNIVDVTRELSITKKAFLTGVRTRD
ncbi:probable LRR receptor-like serine/threonine-protein kinase At3g47570 [Trifolium pratense]|uniref:probable LRR receptor-like serine/threonine-protein kinase At3g47570 n=1 Tax=Trifolium pratense TaxID=57577 RepID=UPI001E693FD7|nr:probable LRR receptor-like serine/threonine-protein kinase At3g47570 [Trifolium pratense]